MYRVKSRISHDKNWIWVLGFRNRMLHRCVGGRGSDLGILGDLNDDGHVNGIDLAIVLGNWGACGAGGCVADIDRDGWVNGVDLAIVLGSWG